MKGSEFRNNRSTRDMPGEHVLSRFARNETGRDFVVGDLHGMFAHLSMLLKEIGFSMEKDRLFSVGDLVDRGPGSKDALEWLRYDWFHACRGNHEQFAIDSIHPEHLETWVRYNGGEWWLDLGPAEQRRFRDAFERMPLAMEIETDTGTVGIVHADVPPSQTWDEFMELLQVGDRDATLTALWSRTRLQGDCVNRPVKGRVERVYCGHTPLRQSIALENVYFIDTGGVYIYEGYDKARLTVVEIHPTRHREFLIHTKRPVN